MAGTTFCTVADVLALVAPDAAARMATDPQIAVPTLLKGDGITDTFDTPFMFSTTITAKVAGVDTPVTLSPGTGASIDGSGDGVDQIVFASAPALGALIMVKADLHALNARVVVAGIVYGANKIRAAVARYGADVLPLDVREVFQPINVFLARWFLRMRRQMSEYDPIIEEYKSTNGYLLALATGKIALPADAPIAVAPPPPSSTVTVEPSVFEPPYFRSDVFF